MYSDVGFFPRKRGRWNGSVRNAIVMSEDDEDEDDEGEEIDSIDEVKEGWEIERTEREGRWMGKECAVGEGRKSR